MWNLPFKFYKWLISLGLNVTWKKCHITKLIWSNIYKEPIDKILLLCFEFLLKFKRYVENK